VCTVHDCLFTSAEGQEKPGKRGRKRKVTW